MVEEIASKRKMHLLFKPMKEWIQFIKKKKQKPKQNKDELSKRGDCCTKMVCCERTRLIKDSRRSVKKSINLRSNWIIFVFLLFFFDGRRPSGFRQGNASHQSCPVRRFFEMIFTKDNVSYIFNAPEVSNHIRYELDKLVV